MAPLLLAWLAVAAALTAPAAAQERSLPPPVTAGPREPVAGDAPADTTDTTETTDNTETAESAESAESAAGGSWLSRTFHRYFSNEAPDGTKLGGQVVALSERYAAYAGRPIAVVIVHQVDRLRPDDAPRGELMSSLARTLRPSTRESVLRQYLLFGQGETLDPLKLSDSERLLRGIEYVADVRLHVVPLTGEENEVAVVVEIRDRLPVGARGVVKGVDRFEAGLFHANAGGLDLRLAADLRYRRGATPETGWSGKTRKRNMGGAFIDVELGYEDSWRGLERQAAFTRVEAHPDIHLVGGISWRDRLERDPTLEAVQIDVADGWIGRVFRWRSGRAGDQATRPVLVPALGFSRVHHDRRPAVTPDSNRIWHDSRQLLAGLTLARVRDYRTSYLNGLGETENLSGGSGLKLSVSYVDGEFRDRTGVFLQGWRQAVRGRGGVWNLGLDAGGYLRDGALEDGSLRVAAHLISPLLGGGRWPSRLIAGVRYHRAVSPTGPLPLSVAEGLGPRALDLPLAAGDRRLAVDTEWRVFPPWAVYGFRCQLFGFADAALLAGPGRSLAEQPLLASAGLGLRLGNPDLVLPVIQLRVAFLRGMDDNAAGIVLAVDNFSAPETRLPGSRPGGYDFR